MKDLHGDADIINQKDDSNGREEHQCPVQIRVRPIDTLKYHGKCGRPFYDRSLFYLDSKFQLFDGQTQPRKGFEENP